MRFIAYCCYMFVLLYNGCIKNYAHRLSR
ncbi:hypothetical protein DV063_10915, partial [Neisseria gonorrhoeae]